MTKHTPEPWYSFDNGHYIEIRSQEQDTPLHYSQIGDVCGSKYHDTGDHSEANARRIVACVNACRGLPTDELEQKGLVTAVGTRLLEADQLRDELLEELIITLGSLKEICNERGVPCPGSTIRRAEATIAKAKGGAA